jgi:chaperone modulatory protein CbpM
MKKLIQMHIDEVCQECGLNHDIIYYYIEQKWIEPCDHENLIFDDEDVARISLIQELQQDLGVNEEAVPIILNLLDQIHLLRAHLKRSA